MRPFIEIDGSQGESGGQMLRTALSLSAVSGRPFRIHSIRAKRKKPGLMRQHLTCVTSAQAICDAQVKGAALSSSTVTFVPEKIAHGDRAIAIGTAGSTALVLQTVVPPLLVAEGRSRIVLSGGTHNPMAPTADFLIRAFVPTLRKMGAIVDVRCNRPGFYPAGGGELVLEVQGGHALTPVSLLERGRVQRIEARAYVDQLPATIGHRELLVVRDRLKLPRERLRVVELKGAGPGNCVVVDVVCDGGTEVVSVLGERGRTSEDVAGDVADSVDAFVAANVPVGEHLADQLLIPMALAGGGTFKTMTPTEHTRTNIAIVKLFLDVEIDLVEAADGTATITVRPR
ncbi:MAG TPA: RNA 3'-terminal phosphate cyclase [Myxococcota bacterium]